MRGQGGVSFNSLPVRFYPSKVTAIQDRKDRLCVKFHLGLYGGENKDPGVPGYTGGRAKSFEVCLQKLSTFLPTQEQLQDFTQDHCVDGQGAGCPACMLFL